MASVARPRAQDDSRASCHCSLRRAIWPRKQWGTGSSGSSAIAIAATADRPLLHRQTGNRRWPAKPSGSYTNGASRAPPRSARGLRRTASARPGCWPASTAACGPSARRSIASSQTLTASSSRSSATSRSARSSRATVNLGASSIACRSACSADSGFDLATSACPRPSQATAIWSSFASACRKLLFGRSRISLSELRHARARHWLGRRSQQVGRTIQELAPLHPVAASRRNTTPKPRCSTDRPDAVPAIF